VSDDNNHGGKRPGAGRKSNTQSPSLFEAWTQKSGKSKTEVAAALGISLSGLYQIISGRTQPRLETALKIEELTEGKLPAKVWSKKT
jgi:DNA-binding XRE family transcriptional regulator